jgi:endonuclease/exonuclease/phosphatase (EEP) superfamily protein YafD
MLWCATQIAGQRILLSAVHTDSFNPTNNLRQTQQILEYLNGQPAILAGDFNANPSEPSVQLIEHSRQFSGAIEGPLTFPASAPEQRIDFIFAPASWTLVEHRVIQNLASDHLPVVSTFRISKAG